jgi:hypothetical protein
VAEAVLGIRTGEEKRGKRGKKGTIYLVVVILNRT